MVIILFLYPPALFPGCTYLWTYVVDTFKSIGFKPLCELGTVGRDDNVQDQRHACFQGADILVGSGGR